MARSWPPDGGQRLPGRSTVPQASFRPGCPARQPALFERRPRHLSSSSNRWEENALSRKNGGKEWQNRRAAGASAGEKTASDEYSYSERAGFSPATGDSRSPVVLPSKSGTAFQAQPPPLRAGGWPSCLCVFVFATWAGGWICVICVICGQTGWVGGSVPPLCLCASVVPRAKCARGARGWRCRDRPDRNAPTPAPVRRELR